MLLLFLKASEINDAELMEIMDHCEEFGELQDTVRHTETELELPSAARKSESSQEWNKPNLQRECLRSVEGEEKHHEGQDQGAEEGRANDWEIEESQGGNKGQRVCHTHERAVPMQDTVDELDITEEGEIRFLDEKILFYNILKQIVKN